MTTTFPRIIWLITSAVFYSILAYTVPRQQFGLVIGLSTGLFLGYGWVVTSPPTPVHQERGARRASCSPFFSRKGAGGEVDLDSFLFTAAIIFRLLLLFATPKLSDDVYRFIWDGRLLAHGFNPYLYLPSTIIGTPVATASGLDQVLFQQLNSPNYFTVYPPFNQAFFGLAALLANGNLLWNIVWLRIPILLSEMGTLWLLPKLLRNLDLNSNLTLLYGLNPLVILELTGNLHFEAVMIFLGLLASWWLMQKQFIASASALALAIATKLLPLLLLPLVVRRLGWGRGIAYAALTGGLTMALFLPFASLELVQNVFSSINLYFQKFEFNASVYYIARAIGYWGSGYNIIGYAGFSLSIGIIGCVLWIAFRWQNVSTQTQALAMLTIYFTLATTVHPWYITTLVAASVFTRFRYPLVWSALIPLSYFTYRSSPYSENLWLTAIEYSIVGVVAVWEIWQNQTKKATGQSTDGFSKVG
ncbi:hypothetical protein ACFSUS_13335 [Spirosoma soli]|uniref:DUF2029 domain-containing protein n=1 Tax=Spirosoma soli TaxID=1770529 RepID=A0ABW5M4W7_9BACT